MRLPGNASRTKPVPLAFGRVVNGLKIGESVPLELKVCEKSPDRSRARGQRADRGGRRTLPQAFVAAKEEELLGSPDRSCEVSAELVALEDGLRQPGAVVRPGVRVQHGIAQEVEAGAMEIGAAALGHDADDAAARAAVLRVVGVADHLHFRDGIDGGRNEQAVPAIAGGGVHAVEQDSRGGAAPAVETEAVLVLVGYRLGDAGAGAVTPAVACTSVNGFLRLVGSASTIDLSSVTA